MKKVELLAPAGNFDALKGAIKAGADAVYLGGELFSARAYADNFSGEQVLAGIHFAHMFGRKVYLAVNTLVKEREIDGLYGFIRPFYEEGLDGVIVQDLGVLRYLRAAFPSLPLHGSTQMALTGSRGAAFIKEEGISRIIPARELSLEELRKIKEDTGVQIEAFIHGAMCYCYSGQCLFSSTLGGRSGNRGRCAQPCRLPYRVDNGITCYPLSMRDMCTIHLLPKLIEAGVDSLKIEGRMKKPAYAAGVTALYRKYIDLYYEDRDAYRVSRQDEEILRSLYLRSEIGEGYLERHNGREMISISSPAYSPTDEKLLEAIREKYVEGEMAYTITAQISLRPGACVSLTLHCVLPEQTSAGAGSISLPEKGICSVTCTGEIVKEAINQPLTKEKIEEQIKKTGNSPFKIRKVDILWDGSVFLPIRALNELRRNALAALEDEITSWYGLGHKDRRTGALAKTSQTAKEKQKTLADAGPGEIHISVRTMEQLKGALETYAALAKGDALQKAEGPGRGGRIYLDYSLLEKEGAQKLLSCIKAAGAKVPKAKGQGPGHAKVNAGRISFYLATPYVIREKDIKYLNNIEKTLEESEGVFEGVLIRNLESFGYFQKFGIPEKLVIDADLYAWNSQALGFWEGKAAEIYLPVECNVHEWEEMLGNSPYRIKTSAIIYGRLPMMVTANCVAKTTGKCAKMPGFSVLEDRYAKKFPVYRDCLCCYNLIYNSVPLSLHRSFDVAQRLPALCGAGNLRLDLVTEGKKECSQIIRYFHEILGSYREPFYKEYTTGHYKRGVE